MNKKITEIDAQKKLLEFRKKNKTFRFKPFRGNFMGKFKK